MKVALIHYWLVTMRGGEKVLETLCEMYPDADIYTHVYVPEAVSETIRRHRVHTTFINKLPFAPKMYQKYLPLMPLALEQLDLRKYDLVISSESGPAKGVLTRAETPHICYCHTPMRYLWDFYQDYLAEVGPVTRFLMRPLTSSLRMWDVIAANRVDHFVANSHNVRRRINRHYRRMSDVVYPPVEVEKFVPGKDASSEPGDYYLALGQLVGYKRFDIAVKAFTLMGKKLVVIGEGPERQRLEQMAGNTVEFMGRTKDAGQFRRMVQECRALIFPGEEDFGIVPLEAMAAGRPVIAYGKGGALETVVPNQTGLFFPEQTTTSLMEAVNRFEEIASTFSSETMVAHARSFSKERFKSEFAQIVNTVCAQKKEGYQDML